MESVAAHWRVSAKLRGKRKKQNKTGKNWFGVYLVGFTRELAATKLALDLSLGAVVLQVVGQVAARQLDGAAVGAGYYVESAGGEVALGGGRQRQRAIRPAHIRPHAGRKARIRGMSQEAGWQQVPKGLIRQER